jgi:hypothetical protein
MAEKKRKTPFFLIPLAWYEGVKLRLLAIGDLGNLGLKPAGKPAPAVTALTRCRVFGSRRFDKYLYFLLRYKMVSGCANSKFREYLAHILK